MPDIIYLLIAIPTFWLATLMVVFFTTPDFGAWTNIFPSIGLKPSFAEKTFLEQMIENLGQLVLPIICISLGSISYLAIHLRSDLLESLSSPFILMAKAKGLNDKQILRRHALPNALIPYITILTGAIPKLFTGSVIIEVIFNIPGIGKLLLNATQQSDWPVVFTIVIIISIATILGYLIGDILLIKLFPKVRQSFELSSTVSE